MGVQTILPLLFFAFPTPPGSLPVLKFIRLYGKWMLPIFVCFLAIAMLTTGYSSLKDSDASSMPAGHLANGRKFTLGDRLSAKAQLDLLGACVHDPLLLQGESPDREEGLADRWLLLQAEADRLGVLVGTTETRMALHLVGFNKVDAQGKTTGALDETALADFCARHQTTQAGLLAALNAYLRAEGVRQLLTGSAHDVVAGSNAAIATPGLQRLTLMSQLRQLPPAYQMAFSGGAQRLSEPLLAHQLQNLGATVAGQLIVMPGATPIRLAQTAQPTEAQLKELFEQGKDKERGQAPHGFGYRLPARVKAEGVRIPVAQGLSAAAALVSEEDVREWFEKHPQDFVAQNADGTPKTADAPTLTLENRKKARELLVAEKGRELTLAYARLAVQALGKDTRLAAANNNQLPADATPTPMTAAADAVRAKYGFMPELLTAQTIQAEASAAMAKAVAQDALPPLPTAGAAEGWVTPQTLFGHPTLGMAHLDEQAKVFPALVAAALAETDDNKPRIAGFTPALRLPLPVAIAQDGTCTVLRFTDAAAPRAAATLEEVKAQVARDARTLAAYRSLADHAGALIQNAARTGLGKFASSTDKLFPVPALARTDAANPGRTPSIPGVGENADLQKAVFDRAESLRARAGGIKSADAADRLVAFADDARCAMILFQIDNYSPIAKSERLAQANNPFQRNEVDRASGGKGQDPTAEEVLKKRLGWSDK